eukprot:TRINITY_DN7227_c0_g1_i1.p2 TRINITY_DN7227_c0_g1~~TRINITY_DN7227_c0_g1_i1.p2  ORF type:complete len:175 (+),score=55.96 TRINITY_DN7227_c0_g1_i1:90-614(+)
MGWLSRPPRRFLVWCLLSACLDLGGLVLAASRKENQKTEQCSELGFGDTLKCSTCARLREVLPSGEQSNAADAGKLLEECEGCCSKEGDEVFSKAKLVYAEHLLSTDQDLEDFVKRKAPSFKNLELEKADFAPTTLQLARDGETFDTAKTFVNIRGWKSDEIRDFLELKIGKPR